jgi:hypothetical protein
MSEKPQPIKATWIYFTSKLTKLDTLLYLKIYSDNITMYSSPGSNDQPEFQGMAQARSRGCRWTDCLPKMHVQVVDRKEVDFKLRELKNKKGLFADSWYDYSKQEDDSNISSISKPDSSSHQFLSGSGSEFKSSVSKDSILTNQHKATQCYDSFLPADTLLVSLDPFPEHNTAVDLQTKNSPLWLLLVKHYQQSQTLLFEKDREITQLRAEVQSLRTEKLLTRKSSPPLMMRTNPTEPIIPTIKTTDATSDEAAEDTQTNPFIPQYLILEENSNSIPFDDQQQLKFLRASTTEYQ